MRKKDFLEPILRGKKIVLGEEKIQHQDFTYNYILKIIKTFKSTTK